jgi:DNA-binding transcriptional LysR family regulator
VANHVAPVIAQFIKQYPEVEIEIDFNNRNVNLIEEGYDLAIRFGRMNDSSLIARPLTNRTMGLVATPQYIKNHGKPLLPGQLPNFNCIVAVTNRWRFKIGDNIQEIKVQGNWKSNHGQAVINACLADLGIAHLATDLVQEYVDKGLLVYLLEQYQVSDNATWLVYPQKDLMPHRVRLLIDFLLAHFK